MKKIIIVLDGVADRANPALDGKTPLEYAKTPNLDSLCKKSVLGTVKTIPDGLEIGSAVANLSLLGFDPNTYRGRAVIEAAGVGLDINPNNMYIRTNFVTFEGIDYASSKIKSYSAYDVSTDVSKPLTDLLSQKLFNKPYVLHNVGSFRNILEIENGKDLFPLEFAPAHDIIGQPIANFISSRKEKLFFEFQEKAFKILAGNGSDVNGIWFWGASVAPEIPPGSEDTCVFAETILMKGITKISKLANFVTDEEQPFDKFLLEKAKNSAKAVNEKYSEVYIHIQRTDDLSHECMPKEKAAAIEDFDKIFLPEFLGALNGDYSLVIVSDHFTFSDTGGHGAAPSPFLIYKSSEPKNNSLRYTEKDCLNANLVIDSAQLRNKCCEE